MYNFIKKFFIIIPVVVSIIFLSSCKPENNVSKIEQVANSLLENTTLNNVTDDLLLLTEVNGVKIEWISSNSEVITKNGIVTQQDTDVVVELFAFLRYDDEKLNKSFIITVKASTDQNNEPTDPNNPSNPIDPNPTNPTNPTNPSTGIGEVSSYYKGAENLNGINLKNFLHNLIDDHTTFSYDFAKTALQKTDEDPNNPNNVILFYTGRSEPKSDFGPANDQWNREHVWAKSHGGFGEVAPAGTDLHHLRPTDVSVNSIRGNKDFDEGGSKVTDTYGNLSSFSYTDADSFEPRDEVKGDVARIIFYMAVRYDGSDGIKDLELKDQVNNDTSPYMGKLSILLEWNQLDPVDDFERNRNEVIFSYQKNRNPFIDYPDFANLIWGSDYINLENQNFLNDLMRLNLININLYEIKRRIYL